MVPGAGLEPARSYDRGILNPLCLPISPPGHRGNLSVGVSGVETCCSIKALWRRNPESNRDPRICNPLHSHSAIPPHFGARNDIRIRPPRGCDPLGKLPVVKASLLHTALNWSGKRDSNSRPQPWQGCALPLSYSRTCFKKLTY